MKTIIQSIEVSPYEEICVLPFLYEKAQLADLFVDGQKYMIDNIRDKISKDGSVTRLIRVYKI